MNLIPVAIEMTGIPWFLTFWIYQFFWPADVCEWSERSKHHWATIALTLWLVFVGSSRFLNWQFTLRYLRSGQNKVKSE
jgi:drug/metabolite transporter (DMT)-like permease